MEQLSFDMPPQPRNSRAEDRDFHAVVIATRKAGNRVYRAGRNVVILNGHRMPRSVMGGGKLRVAAVYG